VDLVFSGFNGDFEAGVERAPIPIFANLRS